MGDLLGWCGCVCLSLCGAPQAYCCWRSSSAADVSLLFLVLWGAGEVFYVAATLAEFGIVGWLLVNCLLNIGFVAVILRYRVFPRG